MFDYDIEDIKESQKYRFEQAVRVWHGSFPVQFWSRDQIRNFTDKIRRALTVTVGRKHSLPSVSFTVDCAAYSVNC
jgi:hypothetical protein